MPSFGLRRCARTPSSTHAPQGSPRGSVDLHRPRQSAQRPHPPRRDRRYHRRQSERAGVAAGRIAHRVLRILAARRNSRGGFHPGAGLVLPDRGLLRCARVRGARRCARNVGRSRQDRFRRQRPDPARHLPRSSTGLRLRREPARRADGWNHRRDRAGSHRRLDADLVRQSATRPQPGFCFQLEGTRDGLRLRNRGSHSIQESQVSVE